MADDKRTSEETVVTAPVSGDLLDLARTSEPIATNRNKRISVDDFYGATSGIPFSLEVKKTGTDASIKVNRTDGATSELTSTAAYCYMGTTTSNSIRLRVNSSTIGLQVDTSGITYLPESATNDLNGETIVTAVMRTSDGKVGYDSSTIRVKTNVRDLPDTSYIYNLRPVIYDSVKGNRVDRPGLIAEEVESILPQAIFYRTYKVEVDDSLTPMNRQEYTNYPEIDSVPKNVKTSIVAKKIISRDESGEPSGTEDQNIDVKKVPEGINYQEFIPGLIKCVQELKARVDILEG